MAGVSCCKHFLHAVGRCRQRIIQRQMLMARLKQRIERPMSDSVKVLSRLEDNEHPSPPSKGKKLQSPSLDELLEDPAQQDGNRNQSSQQNVRLKQGQDNGSLSTSLDSQDESDVESYVKLGTELPDLDPTETKSDIVKLTRSKQMESSVKKSSKKKLDKILKSDKVDEILSKPEQPEYWKTQINLINAAKSDEKVESILNYNLSKKMDNNEKNSIIVCALKRLERLGIKSLSEESQTKLLKHLNHKSTIGTLKNADLVNMLSFLIPNSEDDSELAYTLLHEACWRLRKSSVKDTLAVLQTLRNKLTEKRKETYELGKKRLVENIDNVSSPEEMLTVMYLLSGTKDVQEKVEAEASVMLPSMDSVQTYRMLYVLARNKSNNAMLINKAKKHLCSRPISLDMQKLQNLFFACGVLKIQDNSLLEEMSENVLDLLRDEGTKIDGSFAVPLLISCSRLGWNYKPLTDVLLPYINESMQSSDMKKQLKANIPSVVMSLSQLNLIEHSDLAQRLVEDLSPLKQKKPRLWLNLVHSLMCLGKCEATWVQEVLSPQFFQPLLDSFKDQPKFLQEDLRRQLLNVYGYLKEDLQSKDMSVDQPAGEWRKQLQGQVQDAKIVGLAKAVSTILSELAPLDKYCNINVVTKYGYNIDFEIFVDQSLKAVKLEKTEGMTRVWIKMLDYGNFVRGSAEPQVTGSTAMALRHLKPEQQTVIVYIPYTDWGKIDKKLDHLNYLEAKIKLAVNPESSSTEVD